MSEEEKEAIKNLKHIKQHWKPNKSDELANIEYESICICLNLIEKQQKEIAKYKRYIEERPKIGKDIQTFINLDYVKQEYISKDKIREKIKELENQPKHGYSTHSDFLYESDEVLEIIIENLKELLEE